MNEALDLYLRAHTVVLDQAKKRSRGQTTTALSKLPKWPDYAVVFGCESRTGITQDLTFGFCRILKLDGDSYVLEEEGGFFDDDLPLDERKLFRAYFRVAVSDKPRSHPISRGFRARISSEAFSTGMRVKVRFWLASTYRMRSGGWPGDGHPESKKNGRSCCRSTRMATRTRTTRVC